MAEVGARAWPGVIAQGSANSDTDANTEAIVFFSSRESFGYARDNRGRRDSRCAPRRGSQCANAYSTTDPDSENKDVAIGTAQITDRDAHTEENGEVSYTGPHVVTAKSNFARSAVITNFFRRK